MGGVVSTAASSCIVVGLTERHNGSYSFTVPYLGYASDILVSRKDSKLWLLGKSSSFSGLLSSVCWLELFTAILLSSVCCLELFTAISEHSVCHIFGCLILEEGTYRLSSKIG
jgi:hypothetical protein